MWKIIRMKNWVSGLTWCSEGAVLRRRLPHWRRWGLFGSEALGFLHYDSGEQRPETCKYETNVQMLDMSANVHEQYF